LRKSRALRGSRHFSTIRVNENGLEEKRALSPEKLALPAPLPRWDTTVHLQDVVDKQGEVVASRTVVRQGLAAMGMLEHTAARVPG
jgi:hypothetical protein